MIKVRLLGHIRSSVGKEEVEIDRDEIDSAELVELIRSMSKEKNPGFNIYNTLVLVDGGEAFLPAGGRKIKAGGSVVLIPFSHGG